MDVNINATSFLSTAVAAIGVVAVSMYGAAQFIRFGRILAGFGILAIIPIWFGAQLLVLILFDVLVYLGVATRENHFEYVMTPVLKLACAGLVGYTVMYFVRRLLAASRSLPLLHVPEVSRCCVCYALQSKGTGRRS
ncbi:MAG: hypothetical protein OEM51_12305 [Gammaproteobacteria bacterium]|nr:hypothetical protein [Gammaproteobacteria bacterium]